MLREKTDATVNSRLVSAGGRKLRSTKCDNRLPPPRCSFWPEERIREFGAASESENAADARLRARGNYRRG